VSAICYLGLGSNLDQPLAQLSAALTRIDKHPAMTLMASSRYYGSKAIGPGEQPDFVNAVVKIETALSSLQLLNDVQAIENLQGRKRNVRWGPRTLDIDILLYAEQVVDEPRLQIPHPRIAQRAFVLAPLQEIAPGLTLPNGTSLPRLLDYVSTDDVWLLQSQDGA
jgi:2-amino-4-hydroxy-6-hydroxymethyldihydropteridine diphosphokinase